MIIQLLLIIGLFFQSSSSLYSQAKGQPIDLKKQTVNHLVTLLEQAPHGSHTDINNEVLAILLDHIKVISKLSAEDRSKFFSQQSINTLITLANIDYIFNDHINDELLVTIAQHLKKQNQPQTLLYDPLLDNKGLESALIKKLVNHLNPHNKNPLLGLSFIAEKPKGIELKSPYPATKIIFDPTINSILTTGFDNGSAHVWDAQAGTLLYKLTNQEIGTLNQMRNLNKSLLIGLNNGTINEWALGKSPTLLHNFKTQSNVSAMAINPTNDSIAVQNQLSNTIALWHIKDKKLITTLNNPTQNKITIQWMSFLDNNTLATIDHNALLDIWNITTQKIIKTIILSQAAGFNGILGQIATVEFNPNKNLIAVGTLGSGMLIIKWSKNSEQVNHIDSTDTVRNLCFNYDGSQLASAGDSLKIWQITSGANNYTLQYTIPLITYEAITAVAFHPQLPLLIAGHADGKVTMWDTAKGTLFAQFKAHNSAINTITINNDGTLLATLTKFESAKVWNLASNPTFAQLIILLAVEQQSPLNKKVIIPSTLAKEFKMLPASTIKELQPYVSIVDTQKAISYYNPAQKSYEDVD